MSLLAAASWSITALFFSYAGSKIGSLNVNQLKMALAFLVVGLILYFGTGSFIPVGADMMAWVWLSIGGLIGFVLGDLFLFHSFTIINVKISMLVMSLAPVFAAISAWIMIGETLSYRAILGICITLAGISVTIFEGGTSKILSTKIPLKGILFALVGAIGQGVGGTFNKLGILSYENSVQLMDNSANLIDYLPIASTQIRLISGGIGFFIIMLFSRRLGSFKSALKSKKGILATIGGSLFGPIIGVTCAMVALQNTSVGIASTLMATVPIIILVPYAIVHKKPIKSRELLGASLAVVGVMFLF